MGNSKPKSRLGIFLANLIAVVVFGSLWGIFNIVLGNMVALRWLGWMTALPFAIQALAAISPSCGQLLFEESWEYRKAEEYGLDSTTLLFIAILSTTLDIIGPAWGITLTVQALGGSIDVFSAIAAAFVCSWFCQRIAYRSLKRVVAMTWEAVQGIARFPFATKTNKRRGHSIAFQHSLEAPKDDNG